MTGEIDSWTVERDGIKYRFDVDPDYEANSVSNPRANDEGMRDETIAAHKRGEWQYVGVTVTPLLDGLDDTADSYLSDSLWGVEWGELPATSAEGIPEDDSRYGTDDPGTSIGREYITDTHPGPDMIPEVRGNLRKLRDKLNALSLGT